MLYTLSTTTYTHQLEYQKYRGLKQMGPQAEIQNSLADFGPVMENFGYRNIPPMTK